VVVASSRFAIAPGCFDTPLLWSLFSPEDLKGVYKVEPLEAIAEVVVDLLLGRHKGVSGSTLLPGGN
jgi:hypothetical protein